MHLLPFFLLPLALFPSGTKGYPSSMTTAVEARGLFHSTCNPNAEPRYNWRTAQGRELTGRYIATGDVFPIEKPSHMYTIVTGVYKTMNLGMDNIMCTITTCEGGWKIFGDQKDQHHIPKGFACCRARLNRKKIYCHRFNYQTHEQAAAEAMLGLPDQAYPGTKAPPPGTWVPPPRRPSYESEDPSSEGPWGDPNPRRPETPPPEEPVYGYPEDPSGEMRRKPKKSPNTLEIPSLDIGESVSSEWSSYEKPPTNKPVRPKMPPRPEFPTYDQRYEESDMDDWKALGQEFKEPGFGRNDDLGDKKK